MLQNIADIYEVVRGKAECKSALFFLLWFPFSSANIANMGELRAPLSMLCEDETSTAVPHPVSPFKVSDARNALGLSLLVV